MYAQPVNRMHSAAKCRRRHNINIDNASNQNEL